MSKAPVIFLIFTLSDISHMQNHIQKTILILFTCLCSFLSGCKHSIIFACTHTAPLQEKTISEAFPFDFILPEKYAFCNESNNSISITYNDQVIGGIIATDLDDECLMEHACTHLREYLKNFAPSPMMIEYLSMHSDSKAYIYLAIINPETSSRTEQSHTLFEIESSWLDIWFDKKLVKPDEQDNLLNEIMQQI